MIISLIVAVSNNNVIGSKGVIPWNIPGEQSRFRELTTGKTIIMGRKTFEEIGRPLPNRRTIVISTTREYKAENCTTVKTLEDALLLVKDEEEVFIAGGGQVYKEAFPYADRIYITKIHMPAEGDVYFPAIDEKEFVKTYEKRIEGQIPYTYCTFRRKREGSYNP